MVGNIYKYYNTRIKVIRKQGKLFKCKQWLNSKVVELDKTKEQLNQLEYICTL